MKQKIFIADYAKTADIHAQRLRMAFTETIQWIPFTPVSLAQLQTPQIAFLDMLSTRFSKLQDIIGARIFPLILEILGEDAGAFIDKLNKLEKLGYLENASWWMELREIRDQITHDYADDYEMLSAHFNILIGQVEALLTYWEVLKQKIQTLV